MAQENRGNGNTQSGGRNDVKGLSDDPTGRGDIGGPEVPGAGTGGGTGTTGDADDAGGMGADLTDEHGSGEEDEAREDAERSED
jgi:hypothetical protein